MATKESKIWWNPKNLKHDSEEYREYAHEFSSEAMKEIQKITQNNLDATNYTRFLDYFDNEIRDHLLYDMHMEEEDRYSTDLVSAKSGKIFFSLFGDQTRIIEPCNQKEILAENGILFLNAPISYIFMDAFDGEHYDGEDYNIEENVWELLKKVEISINCENKYRLVIFMSRQNRDNRYISAQLIITNGQSKDELTQLFLQDTEVKRDESNFFFIFLKSKDEPIQMFAPDKGVEIDSSNCSCIILKSEDELIEFCKLLKSKESK